MRRSLGPALALLLAAALAGCGSDRDRPDRDRPDAGRDESTALDGDGFTQPGLPDDASVRAFCTAITAAEDAVDTARPRSDDDWLTVVGALDHLYDVGVPSGLPGAAKDEIDVLDRLVRQSNSVAELRAATRAAGASTPALDGYVDAHCAD
ncbi:hypothetical protein GCM10022237_31340 [Nocardioides ginsengisoli]|uniref:Lipoprotein n=1 Tax=Nocardioides ginsengisoli TaxID=363868 RepID=A0ABW3VTZ2_9ACTN